MAELLLEILDRLLTPEGLTALAAIIGLLVGGDKLRKYRKAFRLLVKAIQEAKSVRVKRIVKTEEDVIVNKLVAKAKRANGGK